MRRDKQAQREKKERRDFVTRSSLKSLMKIMQGKPALGLEDFRIQDGIERILCESKQA